MRLEKRVSPRISDNSQILVKGMDMFGAAFQERTNLLNRSNGGYALRLLRPAERGRKIEINFSPDSPESNSWIRTEIAWVNQGLDGYQTLGVMAERATSREEQPGKNVISPTPRPEN